MHVNLILKILHQNSFYSSLASYIQKQTDEMKDKNEELEKLLFPLFVYLCLDLIISGHSVNQLIKYLRFFLNKIIIFQKKTLKILAIIWKKSGKIQVLPKDLI